ncbi:MAG: diacylglycerol kinase family protein [Niabella sp.]
MGSFFSLKKLARSFGYAFSGLGQAVRSEQNVKVHIVAAIAAITGGFVLRISAAEFIAVLICIGLVIAFEMFNTAVEKLCDFVSPEYHTQIKLIKDLSAGAVLVMAIISFITGMVIFLPKIYSLNVHNC